MRISKEVREKGIKIFKEGRVEKEVETSRRIHFKVKGETEFHSVIFDKEKGEWTCDCRYSTLRQKTCSHIIACKLASRFSVL